MQKSNYQSAKMSHSRVRSSTTLNRKYVRRPAKNTDVTVSVKRASKVTHFHNDIMQPQKQKAATKQQVQAGASKTPMVAAQKHPLQSAANAKMRARNLAIQKMQNPTTQKKNAQELKDQAIKKALASAATVQTPQKTNQQTETTKTSKMHFGVGRIILALSCATAAIVAIAYFVNLNMPDISLRVAAMQTGIDAAYPSYTPRDYKVSSITSEDSKITLNFAKRDTGESFALVEEKSSWDSNALLSNFVKAEYGENYSIIREQGITIYINKSNAAWVNGGIMYKIIAEDGTLTEKQIRSIAVSL